MMAQNVWVLFEGAYLKGMLPEGQGRDDDGFVNVQVDELAVTIPIRKENVFPANVDSEDVARATKDLTSLRHLNEPCILQVLESRSYAEEPYTYLSGVLVSVNPIVSLPESVEPGFRGVPGQVAPPHPFSLAETAFQQLNFLSNTSKEGSCAQSIVIAGESGAGKTEVAKRVLKHLIKRSGSEAGLDEQLLSINPILESFGNASTLRNHNSSRFGKFTKLHFDCTSTKGQVKLAYASISSYLLERSRISFHNGGERTFRVFYELCNGASEELRRELTLGGQKDQFPGYGFRYMASDSMEEDTLQQATNDARAFSDLCAALDAAHLGDQIKPIFTFLTGILYLGNLDFREVESEQGLVSFLDEEDAALCSSARMLGLEVSSLRNLLCERTVKLPCGEVANVQRKVTESVEARDALSKSLYSAMFDWLVGIINSKLMPAQEMAKLFQDAYVGVLDIFGFESFSENGFEQLLINYANEALQQNFSDKVLVAEAQLYRQEGLVLDSQNACSTEYLANEVSCLGLLKDFGMQKGILGALERESECPNPTDEKWLYALHSNFSQHPKFPAPHPKDKQSTFIVSHYAADVTYTIGNFTKKNLDRLPKDAQDILGGSASELMGKVLAVQSHQGVGNSKQKSIASRFKGQISTLVSNLAATQCSFVRCVKPNASMSRSYDEGSWFDRTYVVDQLRCLGVPQTAMALRGGGFPTRIPYQRLLDSFQGRFPNNLLETCKHLVNVGFSGQGDQVRRQSSRFIRALFWANRIPEDTYRCGLTRVFFTPGALQKVDALLDEANLEHSEPSVDILQRFRSHCARSAWRSCTVKAIAANRFLSILRNTREKATERQSQLEAFAATKLQSVARMVIALEKYHTIFLATVTIQSSWRMHCARRALQMQLLLVKLEREKKEIQEEQQRQLQSQVELVKSTMELLKEKNALEKEQARASTGGGPCLGAPPPLPPKPMHKRGQTLDKNEPETPELLHDAELSNSEEEDYDSDDVAPRQSMKSFKVLNASFKVSSSSLSHNKSMKMPSLPAIQFSEEDEEESDDDVGEEAKLGSESENLDVPPPPPPKNARTIKRQSVVLVSSGKSFHSRTTSRATSTGSMTSQTSSFASSSESELQVSGKGMSGKFDGISGMTGRKQRLYAKKTSWRKSTEEDNRKQRTVFLRLRQEERSYVDALSIINGNYYQPLCTRLAQNETQGVGMGKVLPKNEVDSIFSNLTQVLTMHAELLSNIESELNKQKDDPEYSMTLKFISFFNENLPYMRTIYSVYVQQHPISLSILAKLRNEVPKFAKFLKVTAENKALPSYGTDLRALLKIPVNQMARYNEFFHMLHSCTHPESEDHQYLREVCKKVGEISKDLDEERRLARLRIRAYEISNQLEGFSKPNGKKKGKSQLFSNSSKVHHSVLELAINGSSTSSSPGGSPSASFASNGGETENDKPMIVQNHILVPGRQFLCEWIVPLSSSEKKLDDAIVSELRPRPRVFFLFSDVLVVAKRTGHHKYDLRMWIDLSKIWVDASHINATSTKAAIAKEQFEESLNSREDRVYPLQIVYVYCISLDKTPRKSSKKKHQVAQKSGSSTTTKVDNLVLWFHSPTQRREVFNALTSASKALKSRRESLLKMQQEKLASSKPIAVAVISESVDPQQSNSGLVAA